MLVRKVDPEWYPSEKRDLKVGETIDLDNPRDLIINGQAVAIVDGIERTPYELYNVWTKIDEEDYKEYLAWRHLQQLKKQEQELASQNAELKEQLLETAEEKPKSVEKKK